MGRHSVPDPGDPSGEQPDPGDDYDDDYSDDYQTTQFTRPELEPEARPGNDEYGRQGYGAGHGARGYQDAGYDDTGYQDAGYGDTGYQDAGYQDQDYPASDYWTHDDDLGYDEPEQATRSFATSTPPPRPPSTGPAHGGEWEGGDWTGSHRAVAAGRRGVSKGVIGALAAVVVVVGAFILWRFFGDALSSRSEAAAARCVSGDVAVAVIADPSIADQIRTFADQYNKTATPVGDKCVKVGVQSAGSDQVVDGFSGKWPAELGEQPALWIPGSSISAARVEAATSPKTITTSRSLVTSPVMLAMR
ncbi:MAG: hypothetical protein QOJ28_1201, partial [Mycobacterium sp.]|nr:hypothetical protein [Mycobacterium sp.]